MRVHGGERGGRLRGVRAERVSHCTLFRPGTAAVRRGRHSQSVRCWGVSAEEGLGVRAGVCVLARTAGAPHHTQQHQLARQL